MVLPATFKKTQYSVDERNNIKPNLNQKELTFLLEELKNIFNNN